MMAADPKPVKRVRDAEVMMDFHASRPSCLACTNQPGFNVEAHHVLSRGQGGDDDLGNLVGLCTSCHRALHNGNKSPRRSIARFLRSEAGSDHCAYLIRKLDNERTGGFSAEAFIQRLER